MILSEKQAKINIKCTNVNNSLIVAALQINANKCWL